ncbi:hypothetical protein MNV49_004661 [Pseudohyphozyma bogoriensis]|nr:hypothetical protein MNV49_004661 [Pseudohyphozyma bogoriensis]
MERHIFTYNPSLTAFYYPVDREDLTFDINKVWEGARNDERMMVRDRANTTIVLERMEQYVYSALVSAEVAFGFSNSFKL